MFCTKCGSEIKDGTKFCTKCGTPVYSSNIEQGESTNQQPAAPQPAAPQPAASNVATASPAPHAAPSVPVPNAPAKSGKVPVIVLAVLAVVVLLAGIAVGGYFIINNTDLFPSKTSIDDRDDDDDRDFDRNDDDEDSVEDANEDIEAAEAAAEEAPAKESVVESTEDSYGILLSYGMSLKSSTGREYSGYLEKTDTYDYSFDVLEVPVGTVSYEIDDFDGDSFSELAECRIGEDFSLICNMYEVENGEAVIADTVDFGKHGVGLGAPGQGVFSIFSHEYDGKKLITGESNFLVDLLADGASLCVASYSYDGSKFALENEFYYNGSDGIDEDHYFENNARKVGVKCDFSKVFSRKKLFSEYADGYYIGAIVVCEKVDYNRFFDWQEYSSVGDRYKTATIITTGSGEGNLLDNFKSDCIIADLDKRYISEQELWPLSKEEIRIVRNELYARHGRKFDDPQLTEYFMQFDWYYPTIDKKDFKESMLNEYETYNRDVITKYEKEMGYN